MSDVLAWTGIALALGALIPSFLRKTALMWGFLVASNVLMAISSVLDGTWGWMIWSTVIGIWCAFALYTWLRAPKSAS